MVSMNAVDAFNAGVPMANIVNNDEDMIKSLLHRMASCPGMCRCFNNLSTGTELTVCCILFFSVSRVMAVFGGCCVCCVCWARHHDEKDEVLQQIQTFVSRHVPGRRQTLAVFKRARRPKKERFSSKGHAAHVFDGDGSFCGTHWVSGGCLFLFVRLFYLFVCLLSLVMLMCLYLICVCLWCCCLMLVFYNTRLMATVLLNPIDRKQRMPAPVVWSPAAAQ
jgi:hypothetical protein